MFPLVEKLIIRIEVTTPNFLTILLVVSIVIYLAIITAIFRLVITKFSSDFECFSNASGKRVVIQKLICYFLICPQLNLRFWDSRRFSTFSFFIFLNISPILIVDFRRFVTLIRNYF